VAAKLDGLTRRLVSQKLISQADAINATQLAARDGIPLVSYLVGNKLVDQLSVAIAASHEFQLPLLNLSALNLTHCPGNVIDTQLLQRYRVLPLSIADKHLNLAISDPGNSAALNDLSFHSGLKIEMVVAEDEKLGSAIDQYLQRMNRNYSSRDSTLILSQDELTIDSAVRNDNDDELNALDETPLVRFINKLLLEAIALRASDIHFEPYESIYRVRFRIDGILQEMTHPPVKLSARLASRIKIMAHLDISERRAPQDGRIRIRLTSKRTIDVRVNSLPTLWGEKIVLRLLDPLHTNFDPNSLGMLTAQKEQYLNALQKPQGLILVTGPTGSGKSLTLYTGLNSLNESSKNISTVEDPVEITLEGVNQLAINSKAGVSFPCALRAILRQDPDIIMLGEIRDLETAEIALRAAQTGHLVLTTLHTLSAAASLNRLKSMGIPNYNLANTVTLIIAQRLARKLCDYCKESLEISEKILIEQGFTGESLESKAFYRAKGCNRCNDGYQGRIGIYEVVPISERLSRIIMSGGNSTRFSKHMTKQGLLNLRQSALLKVAQGLISLEEANRLT